MYYILKSQQDLGGYIEKNMKFKWKGKEQEWLKEDLEKKNKDKRMST